VNAACWHCGEALPTGEQFSATVSGQSHPVCCIGCRAAAEWIDQLGLADYYRLRSEPALRPAASPNDAASWQHAELDRHLVRELDGGKQEAIMLIDGVRCAACVWLIERALGVVPGVESVQVNAVARRARVTWEPARCSLANIIEALQRAGYRALPLDARAFADSRRAESRSALKRLIVAGFGAMQAMMFASALYFGVFDANDAGTRDLFRWFGLMVSSPVVLYSAQPFFAGAMRALRARRLAMDVPVALAIAIIYGASIFESLRGGHEVYFDSVSMFVFFLLLGRHLEMRARHRAGDLTDALAKLTPAYADRVAADGSIERISASALAGGDRVRIASGAVVPADGILLGNPCRVDESMLSGESAAVTKRAQDPLVAGSVVLSGPADMQVQRVGADTVLAAIVALVSRAQSERPRLALSGERAAARFVARVLVLASLTAIGWSVVDPSRAFAATLAVLVVSCPCAFALAVPAALTRSLALLARQGVLVVHADAIEKLAMATHAVFDKTGTLSEPKMEIHHVDARFVKNDALALAAALARNSHHPVARAIAQAAAGVPAAQVGQIEEVAGSGVRGTFAAHDLRLGHAAFALPAHAPEPSLADAVVLADETGVIAEFHMSEQERSGARAAISALACLGVSVEIASGDAEARVEAMARTLGVDHHHARQTPADKLDRLNALRANAACVIAVGDGINDAPVLAGADVAVAMGNGSDLAQASSDIVLSATDLTALPRAIALARETMTVLRRNQRWALAYNLLAIPFAALGFVPPWLAALGMSLSSLVVVLNATRIGRHAPAATGSQPHEAMA